MSKAITITSDVTGKPLDDYVEIQVTRKGHAHKDGNNVIGGFITFHCEPGQEANAIKKLNWVPTKVPPMAVVPTTQAVSNGTGLS